MGRNNQEPIEIDYYLNCPECNSLIKTDYDNIIIKCKICGYKE